MIKTCEIDYKNKKNVSLYVHIPFCERKCFYCSFAVSVGQLHKADDYLEALEMEARRHSRSRIQTVYIGGGTPSMMGERALLQLIQMIRSQFDVSRDAEWTIEANPEGLDLSKLRAIRSEGINRISLGVQSLNNSYLKYLGRNHDAAAARAAYERIRRAGFDNVNVDLMISFPRQTMKELIDDVRRATLFGSEHVSLYTLTIEPHSRFYARNVRLMDSQKLAEHYQTVCDVLGEYGYEQYEISNFAKTLRWSRHNLNYWEGGEYIGLGLGAHSHAGLTRSWNVSRLSEYLTRGRKGNSPEEGSERLTPSQKMKEVLLFGLRMNRGVCLQWIQKKYCAFLNEEECRIIQDMKREGYLVEEEGYLKSTAKGKLVLDEISVKLI